MADMPGKKNDGADKAYAAASAGVKPKRGLPVKKPSSAKEAGKQQPKPAAVAVANPAMPKVAAKAVPAQAAPASADPKPAAQKPAAQQAAPAEMAPAAQKPVSSKPVPIAVPDEDNAMNIPPVQTQSKEIPMATQPSSDFNTTVNSAVNDFQSRAQTAYSKGTEAFSDFTELAKGNVEAVVESGRIFAGGVQELGKSYVDEAKSAYEQATADLKEMASVKSPTELFQLQGKILRRNFDAMVATGSKSTEAVLKLANESFAPISGRINVAAEKISKVG